MGDLEDLAAARLKKTLGQPDRARVRRVVNFRRALLQHRWITIAALAAAFVFAIAIGAYQYGKAQQRQEIGDAFVSRLTSGKSSQEKIDPKFTISETSSPYAEAWSIANEDDSPLVISRVVFNGEWQANLADRNWGNLVDSGKALPVTLSIGESKEYLAFTNALVNQANYIRKIIYIDVFTSRGNFRYRANEGFVNEKPTYDERKIDQYRKDLEAEALKQKQQADDRAKGFFGITPQANDRR